MIFVLHHMEALAGVAALTLAVAAAVVTRSDFKARNAALGRQGPGTGGARLTALTENRPYTPSASAATVVRVSS